MKRLAVLTLTIFLVVFSLVQAQWTTNGSRYATDSKLTIYYQGTLDSATQTYATLNSNRFSLEDYDVSGTYFSLNYKFTSTPGAPMCFVNLYGTDDGGTTSVLITQIVDTSNSESSLSATTNFANRFNEYFLRFQQVAPGRDGTTFKAWFQAPAKDPALKPF